MPIRINLLAEAQLAEEQRRKNPVRLGLWVGGFCIFTVILWALQVQLDVQFARSEARNIDQRLADVAGKYADVTNEQSEIAKTAQTLAALKRLTTNRFYWAPFLDALQKTMVDDIQVIRVSGTQTYALENARVVGSGAGRAASPGVAVESIGFYIEAQDTSPDKLGYQRYIDSLNSCDYFVKSLKRRDGFVLDGVLQTPVELASDPKRQSVTFVLTAHLPDARRGE
jgi:hypothetical protein